MDDWRFFTAANTIADADGISSESSVRLVRAEEENSGHVGIGKRKMQVQVKS